MESSYNVEIQTQVSLILNPCSYSWKFMVTQQTLLSTPNRLCFRATVLNTVTYAFFSNLSWSDVYCHFPANFQMAIGMSWFWFYPSRKRRKKWNVNQITLCWKVVSSFQINYIKAGSSHYCKRRDSLNHQLILGEGREDHSLRLWRADPWEHLARGLVCWLHTGLMVWGHHTSWFAEGGLCAC